MSLPFPSNSIQKGMRETWLAMTVTVTPGCREGNLVKTVISAHSVRSIKENVCVLHRKMDYRGTGDEKFWIGKGNNWKENRKSFRQKAYVRVLEMRKKGKKRDDAAVLEDRRKERRRLQLQSHPTRNLGPC